MRLPRWDIPLQQAVMKHSYDRQATPGNRPMLSCDLSCFGSKRDSLGSLYNIERAPLRAYARRVNFKVNCNTTDICKSTSYAEWPLLRRTRCCVQVVYTKWVPLASSWKNVGSRPCGMRKYVLVTNHFLLRVRDSYSSYPWTRTETIGPLIANMFISVQSQSKHRQDNAPILHRSQSSVSQLLPSQRIQSTSFFSMYTSWKHGDSNGHVYSV